MDRHGGDEADYPELREWLNADTRHRGAFVRARACWQMLGRGGEQDQVDLLNDNEPTQLSRRAVMGAFSLGAVALTGLAFSGFPRQAQAKTYTTDIGEIRQFRLDDGSTVTLDTQTHMEVRLNGSQRHVNLLAGSAFFELNPDQRLIFRASSPEFQVEGRNSKFLLAASPEPEVAVESGDLELKSLRRSTGEKLRLDRGTRAVMAKDGSFEISAASPDEIARRLAWRQGEINLDGQTVQQAAQLFNRYNRTKILVTDPDIAQQPIVGWFRVNQPDEFARAVTTAFGGQADRRDHVIRIHS